MSGKRQQIPTTIQQLSRLLEAVKAIDLDELEQLVQQAHACEIHQIDDPAQPLPITRQALRMFWYFRRNIESVDVFVEFDG